MANFRLTVCSGDARAVPTRGGGAGCHEYMFTRTVNLYIYGNWQQQNMPASDLISLSDNLEYVVFRHIKLKWPAENEFLWQQMVTNVHSFIDNQIVFNGFKG